MQIWTLVVGSYSSANTVGAYSDKDVADKHAVLVDGYVEGPFELNEVRLSAPDQPCFSFDMTKDGKADIREVSKLHDGVYSDGEFGTRRDEGYRLIRGGEEGEGRYERKSFWRIRGCVYAKDKEIVAKMVNEIRVRVLAGALPESGSVRG